ncbi:MAG: ABC transporter substrate-binding protein [Aeromicrobium sp.]|uniref:ABC transporter substrate-binding protein n=1 Tax=Aeromicrobium sp. TaxID=1871063 RepID=UPI0039E296B4
MTTTTRTRSLTAFFLAAALALAGCSGSAEDDGPGFATVDTAYGEITVDEKPERILVLDAAMVELLDVLGEEPLVVVGEKADLDDYPWLDYDGEFDPDLWDADWNISAEAVAEWEPDLIVGSNPWQIDEKLYEDLSEIAPTYAGRYTQAEGGATTWQESLADLATLTGHDDTVVDQAVAAYDATLAAAAEKLPGLQGKSFQLAVLSDEDQQLWLTEYANGPILGLGLTLGEGQPSGEGGENAAEAPKYSLENIDQLSADVVFLVTHEYVDPEGEFRASLEADPRVAELPAAQNGTLVYLKDTTWYAVNPPTPASVAWWLDQVMAQLEASALNQSGQ